MCFMQRIRDREYNKFTDFLEGHVFESSVLDSDQPSDL
jgi:hypothetical protein